MTLWRVLLLLPMLLLTGCLVSLPQPLQGIGTAPAALGGSWVSIDGWGDRRYLHVVPSGDDVYRAEVWRGSLAERTRARSHYFVSSRHGRRWYFSTPAPQRIGGNHALGGFELTADDDLVIFNLNAEALAEAVGSSRLEGELITTEEGDAVLLTSPQDAVFEFLDDPANSDLFVEVARFSRVARQDQP